MLRRELRQRLTTHFVEAAERERDFDCSNDAIRAGSEVGKYAPLEALVLTFAFVFEVLHTDIISAPTW